MTLAPDRVESPLLRRLLAYWDAKRAGRAMPARADLDPFEFGFALGHVFINEVEPGTAADGGPRFRYRLTGSKMTEGTGFDLMGRYVDDIPDPAQRDFLNHFYRAVVAQRRCRAVRRDRALADRVRPTETLAMPLSADGGAMAVRRLRFPRPVKSVAGLA
jgi:hypothetical protein